MTIPGFPGKRVLEACYTETLPLGLQEFRRVQGIRKSIGDLVGLLGDAALFVESRDLSSLSEYLVESVPQALC